MNVGFVAGLLYYIMSVMPTELAAPQVLLIFYAASQQTSLNDVIACTDLFAVFRHGQCRTPVAQLLVANLEYKTRKYENMCQ